VCELSLKSGRNTTPTTGLLLLLLLLYPTRACCLVGMMVKVYIFQGTLANDLVELKRSTLFLVLIKSNHFLALHHDDDYFNSF
jgi:hypothetical protein